jgi:hypothetical protein
MSLSRSYTLLASKRSREIDMARVIGHWLTWLLEHYPANKWRSVSVTLTLSITATSLIGMSCRSFARVQGPWFFLHMTDDEISRLINQGIDLSLHSVATCFVISGSCSSAGMLSVESLVSWQHYQRNRYQRVCMAGNWLMTLSPVLSLSKKFASVLVIKHRSDHSSSCRNRKRSVEPLARRWSPMR